jgi:hypothetical protein
MTRDDADRSVGSWVVLAAIFVMEIEDVFVARMAWEGQICASCAKILLFSSGISYGWLDRVLGFLYLGSLQEQPQ